MPQELVDDLVQETFLKLASDRCARLHGFAQEHPEAVELYIRTVAANLTRDHLKRTGSAKRGSGQVVQILESVEPRADFSSTGGVEAIQREIQLREIDECLEASLEQPTKTRDRSIFWLYHRQGMTARSIAEIPSIGLTVKGVESVLLRMMRLVESKMAAHYRPRVDAPGTEGLGSLKSY
jgi:RNA polymerase sigma-70 factor, ECF subfamily